MTTEVQFNEFCDKTRVGDIINLRNGERRMLIRMCMDYALLNPDSGVVMTQWYSTKVEVLSIFKGRIA